MRRERRRFMRNLDQPSSLCSSIDFFPYSHEVIIKLDFIYIYMYDRVVGPVVMGITINVCLVNCNR